MTRPPCKPQPGVEPIQQVDGASRAQRPVNSARHPREPLTVKTLIRRHVTKAVRLLLIAAGVGYIVWTVQWTGEDGMVQMVRGADVGWLLGGLALISVVFPLQTIRWFMLLRCRGMNVSLRSVFKLTMVGLFFNFCVPVGSTGGDVIRAYGAARGIKTPGSSTRAVVSVLLDRVAGLLGLIVLAALAGPLLWSEPAGRKITVIAWTTLGLVAVGGAVYLWPVTRRWLGVNLLTRFGVFQKIDEAVTGYRHHGGVVLGSIAISVPVHLAISIATAMAGYAIGVPTELLTLVAALPIAFIVGALPLTFMGLGLMEPTLFGLLSANEAVTFNQVAAMLMGYRAFMLAYALVGGVFVLAKGMHLNEKPLAEVTEAAEELDVPPPLDEPESSGIPL